MGGRDLVVGIIFLLLSSLSKADDDTIWEQCKQLSMGNACVSLKKAPPCDIEIFLTVGGMEVIGRKLELEVSPRVCGTTILGEVCVEITNVTVSNGITSGCVILSALNHDYGRIGCFQDDGYLQSCRFTGCPNDCSGHGSCNNSVCTCSYAWKGRDCSQNALEWEQCAQVDTISAPVCVDLKFESCSIDVNLLVGPLPIYEQNIPVSDLIQYFSTKLCIQTPGQSCSVCIEWDDFVLNTTIASGCGSMAFSCLGTDYGTYPLSCFEDRDIAPGCFGACPLNCSNHGSCINGICKCALGHDGQDCATLTCALQNDCSGHGNCTAGICICEAGYGRSSNCTKEDEIPPIHKDSSPKSVPALIVGLVIGGVVLGGVVGGFFIWRKRRQASQRSTPLSTFDDDLLIPAPSEEEGSIQ